MPGMGEKWTFFSRFGVKFPSGAGEIDFAGRGFKRHMVLPSDPESGAAAERGRWWGWAGQTVTFLPFSSEMILNSSLRREKII